MTKGKVLRGLHWTLVGLLLFPVVCVLLAMVSGIFHQLSACREYGSGFKTLFFCLTIPVALWLVASWFCFAWLVAAVGPSPTDAAPKAGANGERNSD